MNCIRCGTENVDAEGYLFKQPVGMTTRDYGAMVKFTTYYLTHTLPACKKCKGSFQVWDFANKLLILLSGLGGTLLAIGVFFFIFRMFNEVSVMPFSSGLVLMAGCLILWKYIRGIKSNPRMYIKYNKKTGVFYVRSGGSQEWTILTN
ncbi:MAG: hypothetical protein ACFFDC_11990 [Promethearchaeota archaeon]